jgi:hypothetical protein
MRGCSRLHACMGTPHLQVTCHETKEFHRTCLALCTRWLATHTPNYSCYLSYELVCSRSCLLSMLAVS